MVALHLSQIWRYPVKSMRGARCASIPIDSCGPSHDRHWMLVGPQGQFITQRQLPRMTLIQAEWTDQQLSLRTRDETYRVMPVSQPEKVQIKIWRDTCQALRIDPKADQWLSRILGHDCRLVEMPHDTIRQVDQAYANPQDQVGFADGFPFLLIAQASLDHLNERLPQSIEMRRFRPNLVISGCPPHAEDTWRKIRIGEITFRVAKSCSRCIIPTIDPASGERSREPLKTLLTYRQRDNKIYFGQNLLHDATGVLAEGMQVEVIA